MGIGSDGENQITSGGNGKRKIENANDGLAKPKRQMKTPFQLETLEKVYAVETYPSEATRAELSEKLGLSDRQLQMWFCHRRLKDKKDVPSKKQRKPAEVRPPVNELPIEPVPEMDSGSGSGSGPGYSPYSESRKNFASVSSSLEDYNKPMGRRTYEPRMSMVERRAIACVEAQLGEPLREDGPVLGMEFDPLPPDAFGTPIEMQKRSVHPYESKIYEPHDARSSRQSLDDPSPFRPEVCGRYSDIRTHGMDYDITPTRSSSFLHGNGPLPMSHGIHGNASRKHSASRQAMPSPFTPTSIDDDNDLLEKGTFDLGTEDPYSDIDEVRFPRESETRDSCAQKELERLEIQRRRVLSPPLNEERMRKEMERHERERRKEEGRLIRERLREEERSQREQRREMERREKFLQKESERAEKKRQKEELRLEKEAMRRKIAIEKATARRIAKESMDLIEDEQLELMELAAASKGVPSILQLNHETLENLELFRDSLSTFPATSVQLKRPSAISPWKDSEENVGNLLMVWRFLISFTDVLGLWPFTLDEFVRAFHDYDSRLLGEIHVALLRSIIRDIEGVARTPFAGSGVNQYTVANPEGGHPQLVEGAYAWGFDIRSWQKHLNPLTWPEILRQLALSAGFGPRLKKKGSRLIYTGDKDEVKACEDIISTIRSGSAAESAFALMREKGLLLSRKSRHRLTPGTVKFAAFHVLSLEGSKGLTVLELAEKIQKSGLRDLTTSKTPEASISVALTRDVKLFERIAPSTYCVRAPYRKDPADAEAILAEARKRIRAFENGFTGVEDAENVVRDEDSEGDADEDPDIDEITTPANASKSADDLGEEIFLSGNGKDDMICNVKADLKNGIEKDLSALPSSILNNNNVAQTPNELCTAGKDNGVSCVDNKNVEVDESNDDQSWIQGLTEGDYCHLSVEERLNALVALIGIANEGNSIRAVLEHRMEAANALKKQMWAEAQLDKNCMRDITETTYEQKSLEVVSNDHSDLHKVPSERTLVTRDTNMSQENCSSQYGYASKRSRSQLKSYIGQRAEEMYVYRSLPLGQDRRRNRYWQFVTSSSRNDPCSGLIFVELHDGKWRVIDTEEAFEALVTSLNMHGIRESHLRIMLRKIEGSFKENVCHKFQLSRKHCLKETCAENEVAGVNSTPDSSAEFDGSNTDSVETSYSFGVELGRNETEKKNSLERYQDFQRWMWSESCNSLPFYARKYGKKRCHLILQDLVASHLPLGVRLLKSLLVFLEASVPDEALESFWTEEQRENWGVELNASSSPEDLIQVLTLFENAIEKEYLSSDFVTVKELSEASAAGGGSGLAPVLPWIPRTISAVALRLSELDASIKYDVKQEKPDLTPEDEDERIMLHSGNSPFKSKTIELGEERDEETEVFMGSSNGRNKRGRGSFGHGSIRKTKSKKMRAIGSGRKAQSISLQLSHEGTGRGRRTVRRRPERRSFDDNNCLGRRAADILRPRNEEEEEDDDDDEEEEEEEEEEVEEWKVETPSRMMMEGVEEGDNGDDESDMSMDAVEPVEYSQRNWGLDDGDDDDEDEDDGGGDGDGDGDGGGVPNYTGNDYGVESEDYSSDT
ncbi:PREDICTED: homeobox-DDT domain protein RLT1-like isoform X3 [Tarenaya hassleriana]|uniref:homeobox-DDT domain protein RLT1-like isoform X3 n=1 Tax=Tarenaya hassleriana TaxID=28532 RepID=UPI00053C3EB8|nr:PREDICTED: homeobox-DDT domain protein RLT1-like isoform X3 [Tarenaya hassleriana]